MHVNDILDLPNLQEAARRFNSYVSKNTPTGCWLWKGGRLKEYGCFRINRAYLTASRVAWVLANGKMPLLTDGKRTLVLHKCDTPLCVNPAHLFLGNHQSNAADMTAKKRHVFGSRSAQARLTETAVEEILRSAESHNALAARFGVGNKTIVSIRRRRSWAHVAPGVEACKAYREGTKPKLTAEDAVAIFNDPRPRPRIAADYGVSADHVKAIHYGEYWAAATGCTPATARRRRR